MSNDPFAKMPNAELAQIVRRTMAMLGETEDKSGVKRLAGASAALFLVGAAASQNGATLTVNLGGATCRDEDLGDWAVTVARQGADQERDPLEEAPVVLAGTLRPGFAEVAVGCFSKLTVCQLRAKDGA